MAGMTPQMQTFILGVFVGMRHGITLAEYNRRWELIMAAFHDGRLSSADASAAVADLTRQHIWRDGR